MPVLFWTFSIRPRPPQENNKDSIEKHITSIWFAYPKNFEITIFLIIFYKEFLYKREK